MSGSGTDGASRYRAEEGTDGSWLVVDFGADGTQRPAIGRETSAETARQEASTLSAMDAVTGSRAASAIGPCGEVDRVAEEYITAVDAKHNFNHLLFPGQLGVD